MARGNSLSCPDSLIGQCWPSIRVKFENFQKAVWAFAQTAKAYGLGQQDVGSARLPWERLFGCTRLPCQAPNPEMVQAAFTMLDDYEVPFATPGGIARFASRYAGFTIAPSEAESYVRALFASGGRGLVGGQ